jgi:hypothetical protein
MLTPKSDCPSHREKRRAARRPGAAQQSDQNSEQAQNPVQFRQYLLLEQSQAARQVDLRELRH